MARDSGGTYTAPSNSFNPAVSGTVIDEADWNTTLTDIESALTESLYTAATSAVDNALLRADGTSGVKTQFSYVTADDSGGVHMKTQATTAAGGARAFAVGSCAIGYYWGSGAPTVAAPIGSKYVRTDATAFAREYIATSATGAWQATVDTVPRVLAQLDFYRSTQTALVGTTANSYDWIGTGVTASLIQFHADDLNRNLVQAVWRVVWNPDVSGAVTGVELIHADSGPSNITQIVEVTASGTGTVRNDGFDVLSTLNGFITSGTYKQIGHRAKGDGSSAAPKIYYSGLELVWG